MSAATPYPNIIPCGHRDGYWSKGLYDSGWVFDGHRLYREADNDGTTHISIEHPPWCEPVDHGGYLAHDCAVNELHEVGFGDTFYGDVDAALPLWTEVPIRIRLTGGASWTDYGWEHDGEVVWEVVSVPALTFPVHDSAQACGTGIDGGTAWTTQETP